MESSPARESEHEESVAPAAHSPVHPAYLNVPMMVSFLAALEGEGVSFQDESTSLRGEQQASERQGAGRLGVPVIASLLGFDLSGRIARSDGRAESEEVRVVRTHTEASLFNRLRDGLHKQGKVTRLDANELTDTEPGDLVELGGRVIGNPLLQVLDLLTQIIPYVEAQAEVAEASSTPPRKNKSKKGQRGGQGGGPAPDPEAIAAEILRQAQDEEKREQQFGLRIVRMMHEEIRAAAVRDLVLQADEATAVLTLSREFLTDSAEAHLLWGSFRVLGKVTAVLRHEHEQINLTRRTAMGAFRPEQARELLQDFQSDGSLNIEMSDPIVTGPAIQVLPIAVYV